MGEAGESAVPMVEGEGEEAALFVALPDGVLSHILSNLTPVEACAGPATTCKRLWEIVSGGGPWVSQAALRPLEKVMNSGALSFPSAYRAVFGRNLLRNPWFSLEANYAGGRRVEAFDTAAWVVTVRGGSGCHWEQPAEGMTPAAGFPPPPLAPAPRHAPAPPQGVSSCLATSFAWSEVVQVVDLAGALVDAGAGSREAAEGLLDSGAVPLSLSIWVGARCDCGAMFNIEVVLDNGGSVLPAYSGPRDPSPWSLPAEGRVFQYRHMGEAHQVAKDSWVKLTEVIEGYPPGARRALVVLRGKDTQFWAGAYGAKFASAELRFLPDAPPPPTPHPAGEQ